MRVASNGRVRRSETEWSAILRKFDTSGLSVSEFCRREGLTPNSFKRWQQRLSSNGSERFVELVAPESTAACSWELEVSLPSGARLQFRG